MDPNNNQILIIISFCSLILFNPVHTTCVLRDINHLYPSPPPSSSPNAAPVSAPIPSPKSQPPKAAPPTSYISAPTPSTNPSAPIPSPQSQPPNAAPPTSYISAPTPSTNPPSESAPIHPPLTGMLKESPRSNLFPVKPTINPDLKNICGKTDYPSICLSSLTPSFTGKIDTIFALEMAIKAATEHTKLALEVATKLAIAPNIPPATASILADCKENYNDALDNFQTALDSIPPRDIGTINSMLSAVVTDFVTCDDGFAGGVSLMANFDDKLTKMGSNCLAIASLIK